MQHFRIFTASDNFSYLLKLMLNLLFHLNKFNYMYVFDKMCGKKLFKILPFRNHVWVTLQTVDPDQPASLEAC